MKVTLYQKTGITIKTLPYNKGSYFSIDPECKIFYYFTCDDESLNMLECGQLCTLFDYMSWKMI